MRQHLAVMLLALGLGAAASLPPAWAQTLPAYPAPAGAEEKSEVELVSGYAALYAQLRYPAAARQNRVRGRVTRELVIDKNGGPRDVAVVEGLGHGCDEEARRGMRAARYANAAGQDHEIRVSWPFP